jgi:hypothetical protein
MTTTAATFYAQADSFQEIAKWAHTQQIRFAFNRAGFEIWAAIERAARGCRVERLDRARAMETV